MSVPYAVNSLDGRPLDSGTISEVTAEIQMLIEFGGHRESIQFLLVDSPGAQIVLGHTWLVRHKPSISWGDCISSIGARHVSHIVSDRRGYGLVMLGRPSVSITGIPSRI